MGWDYGDAEEFTEEESSLRSWTTDAIWVLAILAFIAIGLLADLGWL